MVRYVSCLQTHLFCLKAIFPDELGSAGCSSVFFLHLFWNRPFGNMWHRFFMGQMSFLSANQQCKSIEENSACTGHNQWPGLSHHSTRDGRDISHLHQLANFTSHTHTHTHTRTTVLLTFFWDYPSEPVPEEIFWTFVVQGRISEADRLIIRVGATPSGLISDPPPSSPIFMPDALPAETIPLYHGLGRALNMLACIRSGVVSTLHQF